MAQKHLSAPEEKRVQGLFNLGCSANGNLTQRTQGVAEGRKQKADSRRQEIENHRFSAFRFLPAAFSLPLRSSASSALNHHVSKIQV
jgi:hypothetical protein